MKGVILPILGFGALVIVAIVLGALYFVSIQGDGVVIHNVVVPQTMIAELGDDYSVSGNEFSYCLYGSNTDGLVVVEEWVKQVNVIPHEYNITTTQCGLKTSGKVLGTIHSHTNGLCQASNLDYYTYGRQDHDLFGVMCEEDRLVIYTPQTLNTGFEFETRTFHTT